MGENEPRDHEEQVHGDPAVNVHECEWQHVAQWLEPWLAEQIMLVEQERNDECGDPAQGVDFRQLGHPVVLSGPRVQGTPRCQGRLAQTV